jgi:hypothetical protein
MENGCQTGRKKKVKKTKLTIFYFLCSWRFSGTCDRQNVRVQKAGEETNQKAKR